MKKIVFLLTALCACASAFADTLDVRTWRAAGPYAVLQPYQVDSTDNQGKRFDGKNILRASANFDALKNAAYTDKLPLAGKPSVGLMGFSVQNCDYTSASIKIEGLKAYELYIDGKKAQKELRLEPATHEFIIKYALNEGDTLAPKIKLVTKRDNVLELREDGKKIYTTEINEKGSRPREASLSPSGKYLALTSESVDAQYKKSSTNEIIRLSDGKVLLRGSGRVMWMPGRDAIYYMRPSAEGNFLYCCNPETLEETLIAKNVPMGDFVISPTGDYLIYTMRQDGPKEGGLKQIVNPEDRQPGWRRRSHLAKYDIATGMMQELTFGYNNTWLADISKDGKKLLFFKSELDLAGGRPTSLSSLYMMDLESLDTECLISRDGFMGSAQFSPDAKAVALTGSPEAFGNIDNDVPEGMTASTYDFGLYILDVATKEIRPVTKGFDPSVKRYNWSKFDSKIYFNADNKDCIDLYRLDPASGKIETLPSSVDCCTYFDIADTAPVLIYYGQGLESMDAVYSMNTKNLKQAMVKDYNPLKIEGVELGKGGGYEFTSSRGDVINGFYVLPAGFNPEKKYPMVVHYYGGCTPSSRVTFNSAYSAQLYAAQGYVVYVVNPSGAAGFGQEFSARHVNTAGNGVAEDIIEGVQHFCADHPFVDAKKIGCISASYGGFMTELLLAKSDVFATGVSHAGISDNAGYWGEGYWGYSYSEVSMAGSYPWNAKDLYVDNSPLYMADKIKTPLLLTHGTADTNVPISESIQLFTALKLLGAETAFVAVEGENHTVGSFSVEHRLQWHRTVFAWFEKYLKGHSEWWNSLYPEKTL